MTNLDKDNFAANQLNFYIEYGKSQAFGEILRTMNNSREYKRIDAMRAKAIENMKNLQADNERILGLDDHES